METRTSIGRAGRSDFQSIFLTSIKSRLPDHLSLSDELAELLNISRDSAYRRIREETTLSLNEVRILCERFNLSFDSLMAKNSGLVSFAFNAQYGPGPFFEIMAGIHPRAYEVHEGRTRRQHDLELERLAHLPLFSIPQAHRFQILLVDEPRGRRGFKREIH